MFVSYPSSIRLFLLFGPRHHVFPKTSANSPFAERWRTADRKLLSESSEEIFSAEWYFINKLGPHVSVFPVPIFGVNRYMVWMILLTLLTTVFLWTHLSLRGALVIPYFFSFFGRPYLVHGDRRQPLGPICGCCCSHPYVATVGEGE
jgi:hypothetical protein